jgi:uncharacterized protein YecE (DUF72 family)
MTADSPNGEPLPTESVAMPTGTPPAAPLVATAAWGYLRLRRQDYGDAEVDAWAERIRAQAWNEAYVFFKHEDSGTGTRLAARMRERFPG